jgi:hypothetical protein
LTGIQTILSNKIDSITDDRNKSNGVHEIFILPTYGDLNSGKKIEPETITLYDQLLYVYNNLRNIIKMFNEKLISVFNEKLENKTLEYMYKNLDAFKRIKTPYSMYTKFKFSSTVVDKIFNDYNNTITQKNRIDQTKPFYTHMIELKNITNPCLDYMNHVEKFVIPNVIEFNKKCNDTKYFLLNTNSEINGTLTTKNDSSTYDCILVGVKAPRFNIGNSAMYDISYVKEKEKAFTYIESIKSNNVCLTLLK